MAGNNAFLPPGLGRLSRVIHQTWLNLLQVTMFERVFCSFAMSCEIVISCGLQQTMQELLLAVLRDLLSSYIGGL